MDVLFCVAMIREDAFAAPTEEQTLTDSTSTPVPKICEVPMFSNAVFKHKDT